MTTKDSVEVRLDQMLGSSSAAMGYSPPITIARTFGAGGARMGKILAAQMGFALWNRDLVQRIVDDTHMDRRVMDSVDEQMRGTLRGLLDGLSARWRHAEEEYEHALVRILAALASKGSVVLVGRGSAFVLAGRPALRIRVTCPLPIRAQRLAERRNLNEAAARRLAQKKDAARAWFVRSHFGEEVDNPDNYDLVLNTHHMNFDQAAEVAAASYIARFGAPVRSADT